MLTYWADISLISFHSLKSDCSDDKELNESGDAVLCSTNLRMY